MDENEKGAVTANNDAQGKGTEKPNIAEDVARVQRIPYGRKLPYWVKPRTRSQSVSRIKSLIRSVQEVTDEAAYKIAMELLWMKQTLDHGEFLDALREIEMKPRRAQYLMAHGRECLAVNRQLHYHPHPEKRI